MNFFVRMVIFAGFVLFLAGCGQLPTPTPASTATPLPTKTPTAVPTNTPAPTPSPTRQVNALPPAIGFALNKTQSAKSMTFDFATGITALQGGKKTELPGLAVKGQDSTLNRRVVVSGTASDTNEFITYEVIVLGDEVYVKGLTGVPNIDPQFWYTLPADLQAGVRRLPTARALLGSFNPKDFADAKFQSAGATTLDDEQCTLWSAQNAPAIQKIIGVTEAEELKQQLGEIDTSELKVWTCADGYIHQIEGQVQGHNAQNKSDTVSIHLHFQMNQFDQAIKIDAPADAKLFELPQEAATATPAAEISPTAENKTTPTPAHKATAAPTATASPTSKP